MKDVTATEWKFEFILASFDAEAPVPESKCDELLYLIRNWAEQSGWEVVATFAEHESDS